MVKSVSEVDSGLEIFNQFVFVDSLTREEKLEIIQSAIDLGKRHAEQILEEYGEQNPKSLLERLGIQIKAGKEKPDLNENYVKFAEYYAKSRTIYLNMGAVRKLSENISAETAKDIILCHELYHYFEMTRWGLTAEHFIRTVKMFGMIPVKRKMLPAAEVAANSFTKVYLKLEFNPQIIEELYFEEQH